MVYLEPVFGECKDNGSSFKLDFDVLEICSLGFLCHFCLGRFNKFPELMAAREDFFTAFSLEFLIEFSYEFPFLRGFPCVRIGWKQKVDGSKGHFAYRWRR